MIWYYIPGNTPSLKNNKEIVRFKGKNGQLHTSLVSSKRHKKYAKDTGIIWKTEGKRFKLDTMGVDKPFNVCFYFVRDTRRKFDYTNALDTCQDLMVEYEWFEDDNSTIMRPIPCGYHVDKNKAGVYIALLESNIAFPTPTW